MQRPSTSSVALGRGKHGNAVVMVGLGALEGLDALNQVLDDVQRPEERARQKGGRLELLVRKAHLQ